MKYVENPTIVYLINVIEGIRLQVANLFERLIELTPYVANQKTFCLEYYISLLCQYLDWTTFTIPEKDQSRHRHITGVRNLAIGSEFIRQNLRLE